MCTWITDKSTGSKGKLKQQWLNDRSKHGQAARCQGAWEYGEMMERWRAVPPYTIIHVLLTSKESDHTSNSITAQLV